MTAAELNAADANRLIRQVQAPTPVDAAVVDGLEIQLKREDLGPTGTFKWRGALMACEAIRRRGGTSVVTASTGNQGAAVAWAAGRTGLTAHVAVPRDAVARKCELIEGQGAELHRHGSDMQEASAFAEQLASELGCPLFEDGASSDQLLGTATIGHEIADQAAPDLVIVPVACGALAGGLASALKGRPTPPRVIGVQSEHFSQLTALIKGVPYTPTGSTTFADGLADDRIVEPAFSLCRDHLDDIVTVTDAEIARAVRRLYGATGVLAEGAGAAPLAALLQQPALADGQRVLLVLTGGNLDPDVANRILGA